MLIGWGKKHQLNRREKIIAGIQNLEFWSEEPIRLDVSHLNNESPGKIKI